MSRWFSRVQTLRGAENRGVIVVIVVSNCKQRGSCCDSSFQLWLQWFQRSYKNQECEFVWQMRRFIMARSSPSASA